MDEGNGIPIYNIRDKDVSYNFIYSFELLVWPHEVKPWFHSWRRGRVEILDVKYNLISR